MYLLLLLHKCQKAIDGLGVHHVKQPKCPKGRVGTENTGMMCCFMLYYLESVQSVERLGFAQEGATI